jgi:DNA primase
VIPDEVVDQVMQAADIVAIIGEHVRLKKTGSVYRGPCPFHQGTNNNFSVMPKGGYTCFVCGEKGSVFTFVQKRLGMSFVEAVKYVGEKSGVEVKETEKKREGPDPREPLWELNATVASWFSQMLWENAVGATAREYLASRKVSRATAERFQLGFAPRELGLMRAYLSGLGFTDERLLAAGLLVRKEEQEEPRPRFRDRLIFPILDAQSHTVGFGGRLLGPGEPKYLNSSENEVFSKGRILYNLSHARNAIRKDERVIVVEGYFDVLRLVDAGVESVVAPMGTALAESQADLLARHTKTAFLLYDSDLPGQKASFRAGDILLSRGLAVRVVTLPDGDDPDTFVATHGGAALERLLEQSMDVFDRKVQLLERKGWFADLQRKRRALDALLPTIRATTDPITRDLYVKRASEAAGLDRTVLMNELLTGTSSSARGARSRPSAAAVPPSQQAQPGQTTPPQATGRADARGGSIESGAERDLVRVMVIHHAMIDSIIERVAHIEDAVGALPEIDHEGSASHGVFRDALYRTMYDAIVAASDDPRPERIAEQLDEEGIAMLERFLGEPDAVLDPKATVDASLRLLQVRVLEDRIYELERLTPLAEESQKNELNEQTKNLRNEVIALGGRGWRAFRRT